MQIRRAARDTALGSVGTRVTYYTVYGKAVAARQLKTVERYDLRLFTRLQS